MIHSSRQARPTSTLRRTASATPSFNTDAFDFSRQLGFQHLLNSPLPSPALPSIVPRHGKKPTPRLLRKALRTSARLSVWLFGLTLLYWLMGALRYPTELSTSTTYASLDVNEDNIAGQDPSTQDPAPIVVAHIHNKPKWTVSIPQDASFPLRPSQYADICVQSNGIVKELTAGYAHFHAGRREPQAAASFIDVREAHDQGLLSSSTTKHMRTEQRIVDDGSSAAVQGEIEARTKGKSGQSDTCVKSLTFLMEGADAGMGKTLLGLWMAYGLAQEEGRAFFIDDSNWAYGEYTTFFQPPPTPACRLPPATQRLPCPPQARHLVVSASTYQWVFKDIIQPLSDHHGSHHAATRRSRAFSLARAGHDALFHLTGPDADYLSTRLVELDSTTRSNGGLTIGLHLRRGDRHPWEPQYRDSYIPLTTYLSVAHALLSSHINPHNSTLTDSAASAMSASTFLLASDDPE
ncbi:MAG: hypothetical protein L6R39_007471, partial [Caloplaca ligustica]